jgi:glucose-6-phosphate isomerase
MSKMPGFELDLSSLIKLLPPAEWEGKAQEVAAIAGELAAGEGPGADALGWLDLPKTVSKPQLTALAKAAKKAQGDCEAYVVIGIGGSYLGAKAVLAALGGDAAAPEVIFAGTSLCPVELDRVLDRVRDRQLRLCVISKSGTTLEPAVAFRILRSLMIDRYGPDEASRRITAVTDAEKGALRRLASTEGWETFVIPANVGGRFSVLTPVGLLPLAVAGVDIHGLLEGAAEMHEACSAGGLPDNPAHLYAAVRSCLDGRGYRTEVLSAFDSRLRYVQEWWKQLFGESEGKEGKGIFPASVSLTTDLHSLGQYLQEGRRDLFETFLYVHKGLPALRIPPVAGPDGAGGPGGGAGGTARGEDSGEGDGLDYLVGRSLAEINEKAYQGTRKAHTAGGVPCLAIELENLTPRLLGGLIYFFEKAVAVSGRLAGVNPFDQPGVEAYKREMFRLLGRE